MNAMFHGVPTRAPAFCRGENANAQLDTLEISATRVMQSRINGIQLFKLV